MPQHAWLNARLSCVKMGALSSQDSYSKVNRLQNQIFSFENKMMVVV